MLVRTWIVHSTLHKVKVLRLRVVLHLVETNVLRWNLADLADDMIKGPLNKLVKAKHTAGWTSLGVELIKELLVGHLAFQSAHGAHWGKTISARDSRHLLEEAINLLQIDESVLVDIHIAESKGTETEKLTLLAAHSAH